MTLGRKHDPADAFSAIYGHLPTVFPSTRRYDDAYSVWVKGARRRVETDEMPGKLDGAPAAEGAAMQGSGTREYETTEEERT